MFMGGIHVDLVAVSFGEVWALVYSYTLLLVPTLFNLCWLVNYCFSSYFVLMFLLMVTVKKYKIQNTHQNYNMH